MIIKSYLVQDNFKTIENKKIILIYGENTGLKADLKNYFKKKYKDFEKINLFQDDVIANQDLLINEISNQSLFVSSKIIIINEVTDKILVHIEDIFNLNLENVRIILISNELDKRSKLRSYFEKEKLLVTIPCYADNEISLRKYILVKLKDYKNLNTDTINLIIDNSRHDRGIINNEIDKIRVLFSDKILHFETLKELLNSKETEEFEHIRDAALNGEKNKLNKLISTTNFLNENTMYYLASLSLRLTKLLETLNINQNTNNIDAAASMLKPKIFWKDKETFVNQAKKWKIIEIKRILSKLNDLEINIKQNSTINSGVLVKYFLINLCNEKFNAS